MIKEVHINDYGQLTFNIFVADNKRGNGEKDWKSIGHVKFDQLVSSEGCDHNLHFHHHKFKD